MKNKKLLFLLASILVMAGCNKTSESVSNEPDSSINTPSSSENTPSSSEENSSSTTPSITHQDPLVKEISDVSQTRDYDSKYDLMLEDFSSNTLDGETTGQHLSSSSLRVLVDSANEDFPSSEDASIYKVASGTYNVHEYEEIGFRIRKVGNGTLSLNNLVLGLRGNDAYNLYEINLGDAVNIDGDKLNELTTSWQDIKIAPSQCIEDDSTEYTLRGTTTPSGVKVLDTILGFHLYAKGEVSQLIEIEKVFLSKANEDKVIDSFDREAVNKPDDTCWWRDSTGFIVRKNVMLNNNTTYKTKNNENVKTYENLVLTIMGDTSKTSIIPITSSGEQNAIPYSQLKDSEGKAVSNAINGAFYSLVINLASSNIDASALVGFKLTSESEVYVSGVFMSNLAQEVALNYPRIDTANISMFDNFNRTQSGFDSDFDKSVNNQIVKDSNIDYAISYNNGDKVSIKDGYATFDATTLNANDYINFKEGNNDSYSGEKYLVLSVKCVDGATLNDFRFNVGNGVTYANNMYSAPGLKLPSLDDESYPYRTSDGFTWLIIDLKESKMEFSSTEKVIDFYYSGVGKLLIDSVFFANDYHEFAETKLFEKEVSDLTGYVRVGGFVRKNEQYLKLQLSSTTENQTIKSLRFTADGQEFWFKDAKLIDINGNVISGDTVVTENTTIIIDLKASKLDIEGEIYLHSGGAEGSTGNIKIIASTLSEKAYSELISSFDGTTQNR